MKNGITTIEQLPAPIESRGSGENKRVYINQKVINGPKDTLDRTVTMVLDVEETLKLAGSLIGMLSADEIKSNPKALERIKKFMAMAAAVE